jgi:ribosomal protein S18
MTDVTDSAAPEGDAPAAAPAAGRRPFYRRRKVCPFSGANSPKIDYKDVKLLQRYISERGKIVPAASPPSATSSSASWPAPSSAPASSPSCPTW